MLTIAFVTPVVLIGLLVVVIVLLVNSASSSRLIDIDVLVIACILKLALEEQTICGVRTRSISLLELPLQLW